MPLAPRFAVAGVPSLEKIAAYQATWMEQIHGITLETSTLEAARIYLNCLRHWSDCDEASRRLRALCKSLANEQQPRLAWQIAMKRLEMVPTKSCAPWPFSSNRKPRESVSSRSASARR